MYGHIIHRYAGTVNSADERAPSDASELAGHTVVSVEGPYFDDLRVGDRFDDAPPQTLTSGLAAVHQAIVGNRLGLTLDADLSRKVTGGTAPLLHPGLVWDVAIGQSSEVTRNVVANLFYRGFAFSRLPHQGDTLRTRTHVVALRDNRPQEARDPTGMAVLRVETVDQEQRPVLDFLRCAMIRRRRPGGASRNDDVRAYQNGEYRDDGRDAVAGWNLDQLVRPTRGPSLDDLVPGRQYRLLDGDVVSSAPELARLTLNIARVHHDDSVSPGGRLVYGGHTIGLALTQASRMLPSLVTVTAWRECNHLGPVREGMTLHSSLTVVERELLRDGVGIVWLRSQVDALASDNQVPVLDWTFAALVA